MVLGGHLVPGTDAARRRRAVLRQGPGHARLATRLHLRADGHPAEPRDGYLQNVIENGETIRQDIYKGGVKLTGIVTPDRFWDFGGYYNVGLYSDNNTQNEFYLYNAYSLCLTPKQLKLVVDLDYQGYSE